MDVQEIDRRCDEFEARVRADPGLSPEQFLAECQAPLAERLTLELLRIQEELGRVDQVSLDGELTARLKEAEADLQAGIPPNVDALVNRVAECDRPAFHVALVRLRRKFARTEHAGASESAGSTYRARERSAQQTGFAGGLCQPGDVIGDCIVERELGRGAFGVVYLGRDTRLDRPVAIKVFEDARLRSLAIDFDDAWEARASARVRHDRIVTLYRFGRLPERQLTCLEFEYIDGGTLRDQLRDGPRPVDWCVSVIHEIADAVAAIHQENLTHRDLKPGNILMDLRGRPYVADFGLALAEEAQSSRAREVAGTVAYMSPEQLRGDVRRLDGRADIWALGVILYEMLTGVRPFSSPEATLESRYRPVTMRNPEVPAELEEIIDRCLRADMSDRYPSAAVLRSDLQTLMRPPAADSESGTRLSLVEDANPYRGLNSFAEDDADLFFGRELQVQRVIEALRGLSSRRADEVSRIVPILGPSGSGKSSIARAGVAARLRNDPPHELSGCRVLVVTPTNRPLERLAQALAACALPEDPSPAAKSQEFLDLLLDGAARNDFDRLRRIVAALPRVSESPVVLLIDQFEELYTLNSDRHAAPEAETEQRTYLENLLRAARDSSGQLSVVLTLRSDFLSDTQDHAEFNQVVAAHGLILPIMSDAELRTAITEPARRCGYEFPPAVVDLLITEAGAREGSLPLLQFTLTQIWQGLANGVSPADTLRNIGGLGGSLGGEAQRVFDSLTPDEQQIARRAFLGLVQLGEGSQDTRRRVGVEQLRSHQDDPARFRKVLNRFAASGSHRLITLASDPHGAETAEVTHESLFTNWPLLRQWIADGRSRLRLLRRMTDAARHWQSAGRARGLLWRPPDLDLMRRAWESAPDDFSAEHLEFFRASQRDDRRQRWRRMGEVAFVTVLILVSVSYFFYREKRQLDRQAAQTSLQWVINGGEWDRALDDFASRIATIGDAEFEQLVAKRLEDRLGEAVRRALDNPRLPVEEDSQNRILSLLDRFHRVFPDSQHVETFRNQVAERISGLVVVSVDPGDGEHETISLGSEALVETTVRLTQPDQRLRLTFRSPDGQQNPGLDVIGGPRRQTFLLRVGGVLSRSWTMPRTAGPVRLAFGYQGPDIEVRINGETRMAQYEVFGLPGPLSLSLQNAGAEISDMTISYRPPAAAAGEMARCDELFRIGKYEEARSRYAALSANTTSDDVKVECDFKVAMCLSAMAGRTQAAGTAFDSLVRREVTPWSVLAAFQLLRSGGEDTQSRILRERARIYLNGQPRAVLSRLATTDLWASFQSTLRELTTIPRMLRRSAEEIEHLQDIEFSCRFGPQALHDEARFWLARSLGIAGDDPDDAVRRLREIIADPNSTRRTDAADALASLLISTGDTAGQRELRAAMGPLLDSVRPDQRDRLRFTAAQLALEAGEESAKEMLEAIALGPPDSDAKVRALLLLGFLAEDEETARQLWRDGFAVGLRTSSLSDVHVIMLGSLSRELTVSQVEESFMKNLAQQGGAYPVARTLLSKITSDQIPEITQGNVEMYQDERGRRFAEEFIRGRVPADDALLLQAVLGSWHMIRIGAFGGQYTDEEAEVVWQLAREVSDMWRRRQISEADLGFILTCWASVSSKVGFFLAPEPIKDHLAIVLGNRFWHASRADSGSRQRLRSLSRFYFETGLQSEDPALKALAEQGLLRFAE